MAGHTLEELARVVKGTPSETPGPNILGVRPLELARSSDISYVAGPAHLKNLALSAAGAVFIPSGLETAGRPCIWVNNPEAAFARATDVFYRPQAPDGKISPRAFIHPEAVLAPNVSVGHFAVIERGARIGRDSFIGSHSVIGEGVIIGENARIHPHVTMYPGVKIGARVTIHAGATLGCDGFGYARDVDEDGAPVNVKKYHSGTVEIEDDVEIGALCAVDRALAGVTRVERDVKLDNLVQIAHNVCVGRGTVIASQVGIAGSSTVGRNCMIGGQVGVRDHVSVGDGVLLTARTSVYRNVPAGSIMAGEVPAMPHNLFLRAQSLFKKLPEMMERIRNLEKVMNPAPKDIP